MMSATVALDQPRDLWGLPSDWWVAVLTAALVLVGVGQFFLFWWQLSLIKRSLIDAKTAADAAKVSADAAKASVDLVEESSRRQLRAYALEDHDRLNELLLQHRSANRHFGNPTDYGDWSDDELDYATILAIALGRLERLFFLHRDKAIDDDFWEPWVEWVKEVWFANPRSTEVWEKEGKYFSRSFQSFVTELLEERRAPSVKPS